MNLGTIRDRIEAPVLDMGVLRINSLMVPSQLTPTNMYRICVSRFSDRLGWELDVQRERALSGIISYGRLPSPLHVEEVRPVCPRKVIRSTVLRDDISCIAARLQTCLHGPAPPHNLG